LLELDVNAVVAVDNVDDVDDVDVDIDIAVVDEDCGVEGGRLPTSSVSVEVVDNRADVGGKAEELCSIEVSDFSDLNSMMLLLGMAKIPHANVRTRSKTTASLTPQDIGISSGGLHTRPLLFFIAFTATFR